MQRQSLETVDESAPVLSDQQQTVDFVGDNGAQVWDSASGAECDLSDAMNGVDLGEFLKRPVQIYRRTWLEADGIGTTTTFSPWNLYFANSIIQNKLNNYSFIRCDLKLTVMINASPFYYGAMMMSYQPLPAFNPSTIVVGAGTRHFIPLSQRPHMWIYPQNNVGGDMVLPFITPQNWIKTNLAANMTDMGLMTLINYTLLESANGTVGTGVDITIYAHAENVVLSGPTIALTMQSKDEYGKGPISGPASAIAYAMGALKDVPVIGRYATATSLIASSVGKAAAHLGYCNTPVISDTQPYRPSFAPVLASTQQGYPVEKLTLDPKCEVTVDNTNLGNKGGDELDIKALATRESFLTSVVWDSTRAVDYRLFQSAVDPCLVDYTAAVNPAIYFTPMAWIANLFTYWRGDIIFRFRIISSQYHRGRFRVTYDSTGSAGTNISNTAVNQAACFNEVIDITKDTCVEIRIPYNQALAWCKTSIPVSGANIWNTTDVTSYLHTNGTTNGQIVVRVVNPITGPTATPNVTLMVSVRAAENLEFAGPRELSRRFSTFVPQSLSYDTIETMELSIDNKPPVHEPSRYLTHMGECITTLRTLVHRYSFVTSQITQAPANNTYENAATMNRMPLMCGFDPNGQLIAVGLIVAAPAPYSWTTLHPLTYIASAFIGYRGSVNWMAASTVTAGGVHLANHSSWGRSLATDNVGIIGTTAAIGTHSANTKFRLATTLGTRSASGAAVTPGERNPYLTIGSGFYSAYKFNTTNVTFTIPGTNQDDSAEQLLTHSVIANTFTTSVFSQDYWAAAGPDWSPFFFLNVPTYYWYSAIPVAG